MILNYCVNVCPPLLSYQEWKEKFGGPNYNKFLPWICKLLNDPGRLYFCSRGKVNKGLTYFVS